jgi:ribosome-associated protein
MLIDAAATIPRRRIATAPTRAAREKRLETKAKKGATKAARGRVREV